MSERIMKGDLSPSELIEAYYNEDFTLNPGEAETLAAESEIVSNETGDQQGENEWENYSNKGDTRMTNQDLRDHVAKQLGFTPNKAKLSRKERSLIIGQLCELSKNGWRNALPCDYEPLEAKLNADNDKRSAK